MAVSRLVCLAREAALEGNLGYRNASLREPHDDAAVLMRAGWS
jgi:hypothetical protein